jgi:DNA polymerase-1
MHEGALALSEIESNGIRVDVDYLSRMDAEVDALIIQQREVVEAYDEWKTWKRRYRTSANLNSSKQLADVLFEVLGYTATATTPNGNPKTDESSLGMLEIPFVQDYLEYKKLCKLKGTYIRGLFREVDDGYIHPSFNLHLVVTYRSSSDAPNFQNFPTRNPKIAKLIRSAFIPRKNHVLVEIDYSAIEVRVAACYHRDPTMIKYIVEGYDMHLDMAAECYILDKANVAKRVRHAGKNSFVFPEFYGDVYFSVSKGLWNAIKRDKLTTNDGVPLFKHLKAQGISELGECDPKQRPMPGTFEHHIQKVEERFWNTRFPVYRDWKQSWHRKFLQRGYFRTKTGFVIGGLMRKNEVINCPIQGSAFHCLLWSLTRVNRELRVRKYKSKAVGQIHDSMLLDVHKSELAEVVHLAQDIMCRQLAEHWDWIIVPLETEAEASDVNWYEKKPLEI